ncbi:MAG: GNAT family N-acetyltransferase [Anaerolineae bacterium]|jgi:ribosomal-protein-alanine N-acetyltransferase
MGFPLETERLLIRPVAPEDAGDLHEAYGDPEVMRIIPGGASESLEATQRRLQKLIEHQNEHGFSMWSVVEKESGKVIGVCGLILVEGKGPDIEVAYQFARAHWGKGHATEAARECIRFGLEELMLAGIVGMTIPTHIASRRVMEKAGMTYEGTGRFYNRDMVLYAASGGPPVHSRE